MNEIEANLLLNEREYLGHTLYRHNQLPFRISYNHNNQSIIITPTATESYVLIIKKISR